MYTSVKLSLRSLKRPMVTFDLDLLCSSLSCVNLEKPSSPANEASKESSQQEGGRFYSTSAPASTNSLLGNFEVDTGDWGEEGREGVLTLPPLPTVCWETLRYTRGGLGGRGEGRGS